MNRMYTICLRDTPFCALGYGPAGDKYRAAIFDYRVEDRAGTSTVLRQPYDRDGHLRHQHDAPATARIAANSNSRTNSMMSSTLGFCQEGHLRFT